jgi:hypothetical protein
VATLAKMRAKLTRGLHDPQSRTRGGIPPSARAPDARIALRYAADRPPPYHALGNGGRGVATGCRSGYLSRFRREGCQNPGSARNPSFDTLQDLRTPRGLESETIGLHRSSCVETLRMTSFEARKTTAREHPRPCRTRPVGCQYSGPTLRIRRFTGRTEFFLGRTEFWRPTRAARIHS